MWAKHPTTAAQPEKRCTKFPNLKLLQGIKERTCSYLFTIIKENNKSYKRFKKGSIKQIQGEKEYKTKYTIIFHVAVKIQIQKIIDNKWQVKLYNNLVDPLNVLKQIVGHNLYAMIDLGKEGSVWVTKLLSEGQCTTH